MSSPAVQRRADAMQALCNRFFPPPSYELIATTPAEMAAAVRELAPLGRTARWARAVEVWAQMIEDTPESQHWAFFQGSVYAGHAAE